LNTVLAQAFSALRSRSGRTGRAGLRPADPARGGTAGRFTPPSLRGREAAAAIHGLGPHARHGLLRCARNDGASPARHTPAPLALPRLTPHTGAGGGRVVQVLAVRSLADHAVTLLLA